MVSPVRHMERQLVSSTLFNITNVLRQDSSNPTSSLPAAVDNSTAVVPKVPSPPSPLSLGATQVAMALIGILISVLLVSFVRYIFDRVKNKRIEKRVMRAGEAERLKQVAQLRNMLILEV